MIRPLLWKKLFILFILTIGLISFSKIEATPVSGNNESSNSAKHLQKAQDRWDTNYSSFAINTDNIIYELNAGQNYTLNVSLINLFLSSNVTKIDGIKLEIRFVGYLALINYSPILFNSINKTGMQQSGSTRIIIPQNLNATGDPSKHETNGVFQYLFHYYMYMNNNTIYNVTYDWYGFGLVYVGNLTNKVPSQPSQTIPIVVTVIIISGLLILSILYLRNKKKKEEILVNDYLKSKNSDFIFSNSNFIQDHSQQGIQNNLIMNPVNTNHPIISQTTEKSLPNTSEISIPTTKQKIPMFLCPQCNKMIKKSSQFCPECGYEIIKCNICQLPIENKNDIYNCPNCQKPFHFDHFKQIIDSNGTCPICKTKIQI